MKNKITPFALFIFAMIISATFDNNVFAQTFPSLGTASSFSVLAGSSVTNTGPTVVTGNVGVSPGSSVTGFPPGVIVGGSIHVNDAVAVQAQNDLTVAYNNAASQPCDVTLSGQDLGGLTLTPGTYCFSSSAQLTGTLILDAQGNPDAVFIFQIGSTLSTASGSSVILINGANACNVFFQVGSAATLGTGSDFRGNILALTSVTLTTGADVNGRVLARNGAVTTDTNTIGGCTASTPTAATVSVSGRVTTSNGRSISGVRLSLTNSQGNVRIATTDSSGYYRFDDVQAGETYILTATGKRYSFSQPVQVLNINEETNQVNFIANSEKRSRVF
jgi:hypothetical protein